MTDRVDLPQLRGDRRFVTDGGLETTLIFLHGLELPCFAAFVLLRDEEGRSTLRAYYDRYLEIAREQDAGFIVDTPTWRASPDWGRALGYSPEDLDAANRDAVALAQEVRAVGRRAGVDPILISGAIGPRGDGYVPDAAMTDDDAAAYHAMQIATFAAAGVDMVSAYTINDVHEAIGIARAAQAAAVPAVISFTVEVDGRLPTGQPLADAIEQVDRETGGAPAYYMVNCAHPTHLAGALERDGDWSARIRGLRANASTKSHAELDEAVELDAGDPDQLARDHGPLRERLPAVTVLGGCCGTDHRHVARVCATWTS